MSFLYSTPIYFSFFKYVFNWRLIALQCYIGFCHQFSSVQSFSHVRLFVIPWTAAHQASLSITNSQSLLKLMSIELVMPSNHLILCHPLLHLPSNFPSISQFFASGGHSIGASASASVLSMNIQDWFPVVWTDWSCFQSKGLLRTLWTVWKVFCHTTKWISYKYTYALFLLWLPTPTHSTPLGHHKALSWAPCNTYFLNTYCKPDLILGLGIYWWRKPRQKFDF